MLRALKIYIVYGCIFAAPAFFASAQTSDSPDAIAIRVIPNPGHLSAARWYKENDFKGSPQSIVVDGYRGVRDGRTVYVNAANITETDALLTNIYLISYNQEAEGMTVDIFSQMLKHWRFNKNREDSAFCEKASTIPCYIDSDCPRGDHCQSAKAAIIRDVWRLEDLADIRTWLEEYKAAHQRYPTLESGSYLKRTTISVWPSWQNLLAQHLKHQLPVDPVNELAPGPANFNPVTGWDEAAKAFDDANPANPDLNLREGSRAYKYYCNETGDRYDLCSVMESGYVGEAGSGACSGMASVNVKGTAGNTAPEFAGVNIPLAVAGQPFEAFLGATDAEGDAITWVYTPPGTWSGWSGPLQMDATPRPDQRKFSAALAGKIGVYSFTVTVRDTLGAATTKTFTISVASRRPPVVEAITDKSVPVGHSLDFRILASEPDDEYPLTFQFTGGPNGFNSAGSVDANEHDYNVAGPVTDTTRQYEASVIAFDGSGSPSLPQSFLIDVTNGAPQFTTDPPSGNVVACVTHYDYPISVSDPDGHSVTVTVSGLPQGLSFNPANNTVSGVVTAAAGTYTYSIRARDQYYDQTIPPYSAETAKSVNLTVTAESFSIGVPASQSFYVNPSPYLAYTPTLYHVPAAPIYLNATKTTSNQVVWALATNPSPLALDASVVIDQNGMIQAGAYTNGNFPASGYTFTVRVTAATNVCGAQASGNFNLTVYPNEWCGDAAKNGSENCDDGRNGNDFDQCHDDCTYTVCGDGKKQQPNGQNVVELCDDANTVDGDGCNTFSLNCQQGCGDKHLDAGEGCDDGNIASGDGCSANCVAETCGDGIKNNSSEQCDGADYGGQTCASQGFSQGNLACSGSCTIVTGNCCSAVDGGWSGWSGWSACSVTCGTGKKTHTQTCTNPSPSCGGANCVGLDIEQQDCTMPPCCVDECSVYPGSCKLGCAAGNGTPYILGSCALGDGDDYTFQCRTDCDADPCNEWCQVAGCGGGDQTDSDCNSSQEGSCWCKAGNLNCDGIWDNGCEIDPNDTNSCGGCGIVCAPTDCCNSGVCGACPPPPDPTTGP